MLNIKMYSFVIIPIMGFTIVILSILVIFLYFNQPHKQDSEIKVSKNLNINNNITKDLNLNNNSQNIDEIYRKFKKISSQEEFNTFDFGFDFKQSILFLALKYGDKDTWMKFENYAFGSEPSMLIGGYTIQKKTYLEKTSILFDDIVAKKERKVFQDSDSLLDGSVIFSTDPLDVVIDACKVRKMDGKILSAPNEEQIINCQNSIYLYRSLTTSDSFIDKITHNGMKIFAKKLLKIE